MNNRLQLYCIFFSIVILPIFFSVPAFSQIIESDDPYDVRFSIWVYDLDLKDMTATINTRVYIDNFPIEAEKVYVKIVGKDYPEIICEKSGYRKYEGESEEILWYIIGYGEMFPHDVYNMTFSLYEHVEYVLNDTRYGLDEPTNYNLDINSRGSFYGPKGWLLSDHWTSDKGRFLPYTIDETVFKILLLRKQLAPFLQFIIPLFFGEALMLITILFPIYDKLIGIYMAFIAFSPLSIIAIQEFLPHRRTMCLPEFYSLFLWITSVALTIRIISYEKTTDSKQHKMQSLLVDMIYLFLLAFMYHFIFRQIYSHITNVLKTAITSINSFTLIFIVVIILRGVVFFEEGIVKKFQSLKEKWAPKVLRKLRI